MLQQPRVFAPKGKERAGGFGYHFSDTVISGELAPLSNGLANLPDHSFCCFLIPFRVDERRFSRRMAKNDATGL